MEVRHLGVPEAGDIAPELVDGVVDALDVGRDGGEGGGDVGLDACDVLVDLVARGHPVSRCLWVAQGSVRRVILLLVLSLTWTPVPTVSTSWLAAAALC